MMATFSSVAQDKSVANPPLPVIAVRQASPRLGDTSFEAFDRRAQAGEALSVVYFGASLSWGANASDPNLTSYRAIISDQLRARYPKAPLRFWDGAIGGTNSQLGVFRVEHDVLRRKPDLVFLDFSANDGLEEATPETLASYEAILRRLVTEARVPVVIVSFPFRWHAEKTDTSTFKRLAAHKTLAAEYGVPLGDAVSHLQKRVHVDGEDIKRIWPFDGAHPGDHGYAAFAEPVWAAFLRGVNEKMVAAAPQAMRYAATYTRATRQRLSQLGALPAGWTTGHPNRVAAWHDAVMSRWLEDVVIGRNRRNLGQKKTKPVDVAPLRVKFSGETVLLFGEETMRSGKYRAFVDGQTVWAHPKVKGKPGGELIELNSSRFGGNRHHVRVLATGLDPDAVHELVIEPVLDADADQEIRLESICVAGGRAKVWRSNNAAQK